MNDEWYDENVKKVIAQLDENTERVVILEMKRVSTVEDGGYAWMASSAPLASPLATATVPVSVIIKGWTFPHYI